MNETEFERSARIEYPRSSIDATREIGLVTLRRLSSGAFVVVPTLIGTTAAQSRFQVPLRGLSFVPLLAGMAFAIWNVGPT